MRASKLSGKDSEGDGCSNPTSGHSTGMAGRPSRGKAGREHCSKAACYSITSSAAITSVRGTVGWG
jgi:hypothetical protein